MKAYLCLIISLVVIQIAESYNCADPHAEWKNCGSSKPESCDTVGKWVVRTFDCRKGCFCKEPYVQSKWGCILPEMCKQREDQESGHHCSDPNSQWNNCGSACPDTCDNIHTAPICTQQCKQGCFCKPPFIGSKWGCVLPRHCPQNVTKSKLYS